LPLYHTAGKLWKGDRALAMSSPPYRPVLTPGSGEGIDPGEKDILMRWGVLWVEWNDISLYDPDVVVMCDPFFNHPIGDLRAILVNINHGLISKGLYYTSHPIALRENRFDLIAVPGPFHLFRLSQVVKKPILVSGVIKFDPVFQNLLTSTRIRELYATAPDEPVVLFAPTYNPQLSGVPIVRDQVIQWAKQGWRVWVKLHPMSSSEWGTFYQLISQIEPRVTYLPDLDLTPALVGADVIVTDVSSAIPEAAILNKPIVLINNPLQREYPYYDPNDVEYLFRDAGWEVTEPEEIVPTIRYALEHPEEKSDCRRRLAEALGGPKDGKAALRVLAAIDYIFRNNRKDDKITIKPGVS
ncbi:MAG: CDP-glycerol glycerophosphotransferase family protein, partial [bacterium]